MARKRNPQLKLVKPPGKEEQKNSGSRRRRRWLKSTAGTAVIICMMLTGTYLLAANHPYTKAHQVKAYEKTFSESSRYVVFRKGIVRYNRNGVAYIDKQNKERWIQSSQFSNPAADVNENAFAIGDIGGNFIQVFTEKGLKGEIETPLPIEKFSVSNQGIVSVLMKNEMSPQIVTYDAAGNILVENQVTAGSLGYPVGLEMSPDGTVLAVSCLSTSDGTLVTNIIYYNFGEAGKDKKNLEVTSEVCENSVVPELFFMDKEVSVAVGDHSFLLFKGKDVPVKQKEIELNQEIRSVFHTDKYIGFILLNAEKSGFELRLYDKNGKQVLNMQISGDYSNVQMSGNEIILYEGSQICIITATGVVRYKGSLGTEPLVIAPVNELNQYLMMDENELQLIKLGD